MKSEIVHLSGKKFILGCSAVSVLILLIGQNILFPSWLIALEVFLAIITLFILGSIKYRLDKNALTYGAGIMVASTFFGQWWTNSNLHRAFLLKDYPAVWFFFRKNFLTLHGLDQLVHADTMLFILGLTFFVSVIAQTRILESVSFSVLRKNKGDVVKTVAIIIAIVSFASGILDGVSMIGLMIRTLVIILFMARAKDEAVLYAVMVSTVVTTVCGMWLAYGEPPNLIMKANLHPHLNDAFFLRYCLPVAVGSYFIILWNIRKKLTGYQVNISKMDILDLHTADVRFLQASRHGKVLIPVEFIDDYTALLGNHLDRVTHRLHQGEPLGKALVQEGVPPNIRKELLGHFVSEDLAEALDEHYHHHVNERNEEADRSAEQIRSQLESAKKQMSISQKIGAISFIPFIGFLVWHALNHEIPLFISSFAGFSSALFGIVAIPKMRKLALKEAWHEYMEYLFLFPLFFSITLLQKSGFFSVISELLRQGIQTIGASHIAYIQFVFATFLSAMLDNNVVADFSARAIQGIELGVLHLFAMAQIAGYAAGGCWTHIGSAQSVVAYAFIRKEVNEHFTPWEWIKSMTPVIIEIFILMTFIVYGESFLLKYFSGR